jgi:Protein of unknown function (DUF1569)
MGAVCWNFSFKPYLCHFKAPAAREVDFCFPSFMLHPNKMQSIFNKSDYQALLDRIHRLKADTAAQWGKMDVAQMLAHLQVPLRVAAGEVKPKRGLIGILFGSLAKKRLSRPEPMPRNLPTDPQFVMKESKDFDLEKSQLLAVLQKLVQGGPDGFSKAPHPFFGKMTPEEWDILSYKHLDHHLRQFGV